MTAGGMDFWEGRAAAHAVEVCGQDPHAAKLYSVLLDVDADLHSAGGREPDAPVEPGLFSLEMAPEGRDALVNRTIDDALKTLFRRTGGNLGMALLRLAEVHEEFRLLGMPLNGERRRPVRPDLDMVSCAFPGWRFYGYGLHWRMLKYPVDMSAGMLLVQFVLFVDREGRVWRCERPARPDSAPTIVLPLPDAPPSAGLLLNGLSRLVSSMVGGGMPVIPLEPVR